MNRENVFKELWAAQDEAFELMTEYDSMPRFYGIMPLYQAEADVCEVIGKNPGITTTEIAAMMRKTTSACSQIIKKLVAKELVEQERNPNNKRIYNLYLTDKGRQVYYGHIYVNVECQKHTLKMLEKFTDEELAMHAKVQKVINEAYKYDIKRFDINGENDL